VVCAVDFAQRNGDVPGSRVNTDFEVLRVHDRLDTIDLIEISGRIIQKLLKGPR